MDHFVWADSKRSISSLVCLPENFNGIFSLVSHINFSSNWIIVYKGMVEIFCVIFILYVSCKLVRWGVLLFPTWPKI